MQYGVLTICLDAAATIGKTIDSVLRQSRPPCHYLFVDGGSSDATRAVIEAERERAERLGVRFELLEQAPLAPGAAGIPSAWNQGLRKLRGDVLFLLNADDWYEREDAAVRVLEALDREPNAGMAVCPVVLRREPGAPPEKILRPRWPGLLPVLMPVPHPGCFVRREVYERVGGYDERYAISADYDFIWRCRNTGIGRVIIPTPLVGMRTGGRARQQRRRARKETCEIACRYCRLPLFPRLAYLIRTISNR